MGFGVKFSKEPVSQLPYLNKCFCTYAKNRWGKESSAHQFLCPWKGNVISPRCAQRKGKGSLPVCPRVSSNCTVCSQVVCPPSPQEHCDDLKASHWPCCRPLELQSLSPTGCKNSENSASLVFPVSGFGEMFFLCSPLCTSLLSLCVIRASSPLQHLQSVSLPNRISVPPAFPDAASSLFYLCSLFCQSSD